MAVTSIHTPEIDESKYSLPIENGGTSARSPEQAAENIGLVSTDQVDQQDGIALLSSTNNVQRKNYPLSLSDTSLPVFFGDHAFYLDEEMTIQITNYDGLNTYTIDASRMQNTTCVMDGDQITLSSSNGIAGMQVLVINGREYTFEIKPRRPEQPFLINLSGNLTANGIEITNPIPFEGQAFTSSNFLDTSGMLSHASTVWEISTNNTFNTLAFSSNNAVDLVSWNVFNFTPGTSYFLRFAHVGDNGVSSQFSPTYEFITAEYLAVFKPSILSPIASAINVSPLPTISSSAFNFIGTGTFVSSTYYAHDTGYIDTAPSVQYFKVKKDATGLHYALSSSMEYVLWNGTTSAWSTMTYGQMWRREGEAIRISGMTDLGSSIRVTVQFFDAHVGVRWQSTIDIPTPTIAPIHLSSDWQLATDADFTNIIRTSMNDGVNLTTWSPSQLPYLSIFYVKVRYRSDTVGSDGSPYSSWSNAVMFTTMADNRSIQKPVALMLNDDYTDISKTNPQFLGSAFTPVNYTDSHVKSQWQISTNSTFTNVVNDSGWSNDLTSYNPTVSLNEGTSYFARVRYQGNVKTSDWSDAVMFTIAEITSATETVTPPTVTMTGVPSVTPIANGSAFITDYVYGLHVATDWQLSTNATFTNIVASLTNDTSNKLAWQLTGLAYSTTYYVRCRYRSQFNVSEWSAAASFTTMADNRYIQTPSLVVNYPNNVQRPIPTASGFVPVNFSGVHESSDWVVSRGPDFTAEQILYQTTADPDRLYTIEQPYKLAFAYPIANYYHAKVRFRSQGIVSDWSATLKYFVSFET